MWCLLLSYLTNQNKDFLKTNPWKYDFSSQLVETNDMTHPRVWCISVDGDPCTGAPEFHMRPNNAPF